MALLSLDFFFTSNILVTSFLYKHFSLTSAADFKTSFISAIVTCQVKIHTCSLIYLKFVYFDVVLFINIPNTCSMVLCVVIMILCVCII